MGVHWKWVATVRRKFSKSQPRNTIIVVHINNSRSLSIGGSTTGGDEEEEEVKAVEALEAIEEKSCEETVERTEGGVNRNVDGNGGSQLKKKGGLTEQQIAAIKIQAFFRGYLARRAFQALRSLVQLQAMVRGVRARKQSRIALNCMQALVRLQARVRSRQLLSSMGDNFPLKDPSLVKEVEVQRHVAASIPLLS